MLWDAFVTNSRNGTFLFYRDYMEYHRDRFEDMSLLVLDGDVLVAVLPANRDGETLISHGGLTYGGLVSGTNMKTPQTLQAFSALFQYLQTSGITRVLYRPSPSIYHRAPAEEDRYALHLSGAVWEQSRLLSVVDMRARLPYQKRRERGEKNARKLGITCGQSDDLAEYWKQLEAVLFEAHGAKPVHSLAEITALTRRFPDHIKLYAAYHEQTMVAGVLIYETHTTARAQYIAATEAGRRMNALDLLFVTLLDEVYAHKWYFDFGSSHEGQRLNVGLIEQKEGFGARAVALDQYRLELSRWTPEHIGQALL
jgi:hypothetical protein